MSKKKSMELAIKNMVCSRCKTVVRQTLEELGFEVRNVELGRAEVEPLAEISGGAVREALERHGFELPEGRHQKLAERIKVELINYVQQLEEHEQAPKISDFLSDKLHKNYSSLSSAFSEAEEITIERYLIHLKIERVKELLSYGELTLSEIAWKLNYSSVSYLSTQFKTITGMSVTDYKKARESFRKPLDNIG